VLDGLSSADIGKQVEEYLYREVVMRSINMLLLNWGDFQDAIKQWATALENAVKETSQLGAEISLAEEAIIANATDNVRRKVKAMAGYGSVLAKSLGILEEDGKRTIQQAFMGWYDNIESSVADTFARGIREGLSGIDIAQNITSFLKENVFNIAITTLLANTPALSKAIQNWQALIQDALTPESKGGAQITSFEKKFITSAERQVGWQIEIVAESAKGLAESIGLTTAETLHEIDSFTQSGTQRVISVIKRGFQEGDLSTLGEELGRDFSDSFYDLLSEEMVKQSALEALWKDFGATFRTAMEGGLTEAEIASLRKLREDIIAEGEEIAGELDKVMADLGIDITNTAQESVSSAGREASEQFIESFTSGMSSSISSSLSRAIEAGFDIVEYGTDLAEQFNRAFMNTIIEKMVEASALKPMLEQFGGDLFAALQDSVLDPVETQMLKAQKDQMILTSKQLGRNVDDAMRALDIEFAQKEAEAAAGREETETFQTISNITRFQANQIVAQLSLHGSYLKTIADTNIKIVELNNAIAESTRTLQLQKITINQSNGLDDKTLADRNLQTQQAQGLQI
jgi:hypothetical protein